tara:strand:+ start:655 stop:1695 length:1041 start_codon:yes stop_codon:yes gene_type:complete
VVGKRRREKFWTKFCRSIDPSSMERLAFATPQFVHRYVRPRPRHRAGRLAEARNADVDRAVAAAKAGFPVWRDVAPLERARILKEVARLLRANARDLATIDVANCGNPVTEMIADANIVAAQLEFFAGLVTEIKGASIPMGPHAVNFSMRQPLGLIARIIAFNHPFMFCTGKIAAPVAAGNSVIMKSPAESSRASRHGQATDDDRLAGGYYLEHTIFADVTPSMRIARQEIFGPDLGVRRWDDEAVMTEQVNALEYGLTCSIWRARNQQGAPHRDARRGWLRRDQRGREAFSRRRFRRRQEYGHRPRGMSGRTDHLYRGEEHPHRPERTTRTMTAACRDHPSESPS